MCKEAQHGTDAGVEYLAAMADLLGVGFGQGPVAVTAVAGSASESTPGR